MKAGRPAVPREGGLQPCREDGGNERRAAAGRLGRRLGAKGPAGRGGVWLEGGTAQAPALVAEAAVVLVLRVAQGTAGFLGEVFAAAGREEDDGVGLPRAVVDHACQVLGVWRGETGGLSCKRIRQKQSFEPQNTAPHPCEGDGSGRRGLLG